MRRSLFMENVFQRGTFQSYKVQSLNEAMENVSTLYHKKMTIFLSHKHDDLDDLKGVIGFLESQYNVKVYINHL